MSLVIAHDTWQVWRVWHKPVNNCRIAAQRKTRTRRTAITISIVCNLVVLGFLQILQLRHRYLQLAGAKRSGWKARNSNTFFRVVLPLGISFYTFQALSYTIDVYRGEAEAMAELHRFLLLRFDVPASCRRADPEILVPRRSTQKSPALHPTNSRAASRFSCSGWRKRSCWRIRAGKSRTPHSTPARSERSTRGSGRSRYSFQIYFDFSGYSDMAIGLGLMFGFVFAKNFDSPYRSRIDHRFLAALAHLAFHLAARISLHSARRQPRAAFRRTYFNLIVTMLTRRALARRIVELRDLGRTSWRDARIRAQPGPRRRFIIIFPSHSGSP